jgi:dipeptidyl-peptidase-4
MIVKTNRIYAVALLVGALALLGTPSAQAQTAKTSEKALTVERLYSAPNLSGALVRGIEWSPDGTRFAYFHEPVGGKDAATELWAMDAATGKTSVLVGAKLLGNLLAPPKQQPTQATGLGRATPQDYQWAPDGSALLFVSDTQLVWLDLKSMSASRLVNGDAGIEDAKISPDSKWVSYVQDFNLWVVSVATMQKTALTSGGSEEILKGKLDWLYPEELSNRTAYWWSPDSSHVAYFEMDERPVTKYPIYDMSTDTGAVEITRFPQAGEANPIVRVGVVSVTGGETRWLDTGAETNVYIARVNWAPDSAHIAVQRLNRDQTKLDLLLCDAASGAARTILTETDKYWINLSDDFHFLNDDVQFLWTSERTGFRHIYLYSIAGKLLKQVTSGEWAVTGVEGFGPQSANGLIVDERHGFVYFLSNKGSAIEAQLFRASLDDGSIMQVTHSRGVHLPEISPDESAFVDTYSNAITPPKQDLDRIDGSRIAILAENDVPDLKALHLPAVEFTTVTADDGTILHASILKPADFDPARKYPVLIEVYGGPDAQIVRDEWEPGNLWSQIMAEKGYIIWSLDNRGSTARGHAFETPLYHQFGKVELADQLSGVKYLKSQAYVDPSRIGIWGWSYGAYMTLTALFHAPEIFKVGVAVAPVTDWRLYDTAYTERYMGLPQANVSGYHDSSPANFAQNLKGKLMVAHGTGDDNVHFANTALLLNHFIEAGKYPELMIFPGRGHPISDRPAQIELFNRITQFLLNNL